MIKINVSVNKKVIGGCLLQPVFIGKGTIDYDMLNSNLKGIIKKDCQEYTAAAAGYADKAQQAAEEAAAVLENKADKGTTLADYGITDAYTKEETNTLLAEKAEDYIIKTKGVYEGPLLTGVSTQVSLAFNGIYTAYEAGKNIKLSIKNWAGGVQYLPLTDIGYSTPYAKFEGVDLTFDSIISITISGNNGVWSFARRSFATETLSNVSDETFLAKLNKVLPDGDEVSY